MEFFQLLALTFHAKINYYWHLTSMVNLFLALNFRGKDHYFWQVTSMVKLISSEM